MFYCYILYSLTLDKFYIGFTADELNERLRKHNSKHKGYTSKSKDWEIKYFEKFQNKVDAMNREKEIKKWKSRKMVEKLVEDKASRP